MGTFSSILQIIAQMLLYVNFHCFPHLGGSWIFPFCVWAHPFAVSLLFFFKIPAVYFISLIWLKKWPYAAHRAEVRSANSHDVVPKLSKVLPKLHQIFLKVIPNYLKVVSKLPSCSSQLVPKCCPCSFQMEPCDLQVFPSAAFVVFEVPKWCQGVSIYVTMWPRDVLSGCLWHCCGG